MSSIRKQGLIAKSRNFIHLAFKNKNGELWFNSKEVLVYIDIKAALDDGIIFYKCANNVIYTNGVNGVLSPRYIKKIEIMR